MCRAFVLSMVFVGGGGYMVLLFIRLPLIQADRRKANIRKIVVINKCLNYD